MDLRKLISSVELMYKRLAKFVLTDIDLHENMTILEGGCGRGQLTIPLIHLIEKKLHNYKYFALDLSIGPYKNTLKALKKTIFKSKSDRKVEVVKGDVTSINAIGDNYFSLIISNELFCDLGRQELEKALQEFYRVLKSNGQMCHSELISFPFNFPQKLFITADSYSTEILTSTYEWFSPCVDEVIALMYKIGFGEFLVKYFERNIQLKHNDAVEELQNWHLDKKFFDNYNKDIKEYNLEYPLSNVIYCRKKV